MRLAGHWISAALIALVVSGHAQAQTSAPSTIRVENAWARATPARAKTGAAYVAVINNGGSADRLLSATAPLAQEIQFHKETEDNGISRMRELRAVEIDPGAKVIFKPGDMHMMMVRLKQPLKEGETFPLTLTFEKAGKIDVTVSVAKVGAMQSGDMKSMMHGAGGPTKK
jgi:copper(I)-binding protein